MVSTLFLVLSSKTCSDKWDSLGHGHTHPAMLLFTPQDNGGALHSSVLKRGSVVASWGRWGDENKYSLEKAVCVMFWGFFRSRDARLCVFDWQCGSLKFQVCKKKKKKSFIINIWWVKKRASPLFLILSEERSFSLKRSGKAGGGAF